MVKPSKSMQPEHVDLEQAIRRTGSGAAFGEDSFRNYMAVKIATQRKQFGLVLPPPPRPQPPLRASDTKPPPTSKNSERETHVAATGRNRTPSSYGPSTTATARQSKPAGTECFGRGRAGILYKRPTLLERRSSLAPSCSSNAVENNRNRVRINPNHQDGTYTDCATVTSDRSVHFAEENPPTRNSNGANETKGTNTKRSTMESLIHRLKRRHGRGNKRLERKTKREKTAHRSPPMKGDAAESRETSRAVLKPAAGQEDSLTELARIFATADDENGDDLTTTPFGDDPIPNADHEICSDQEMDTERTIVAADEGTSTPTAENGLTELARMFLADGDVDDDDPPVSLNRDGSRESQRMIADLDIARQNAPTETRSPAASGWESPDADEDGSSHSTPELESATDATTLSPNTVRKSRPDLFFYGVVVKVAGYTNPDNETLKRLLQKHGGDLETYETERVTHIIAQQLSMAKANLYKKARRPRPVCRPTWILDSIREGKMLPHGKYLLIEEKDQQQMGIQAMFQKDAVGKRLDDNNMLHSSKSLLPQKVVLKRSNPYAKRKIPPHQRDCNPNESLQKSDPYPSKSAQTEPRFPIQEILEDDLGATKGPKKTGTNDNQYINGKVRTIGTDPNFLDSYFENSRLSFIGSFKQRAASTNHSNKNMPSSHASKLIFHVDMDCFFASVVLRNFPQYKNKPVVISHHGKRSSDDNQNDGRRNHAPFDHSSNQPFKHIPKNSYSECATCNYEARKYGIKKGMFLGRAKELCPELIVLDYDFQGYEEVSQQVLEILDRVASSEHHYGVVEMVSCDEAYMQLNFDSNHGVDSVYDNASRLAESIRTEIFNTTQCTASIGVGSNKFLAKLGTDKAKPNNSYCVRDHRELLKCLKLRDMHGVGWRTEHKLTEEGLVSVQDIWDLGSRGETELIRILGPGTGKKVFRFTQGQDDRSITPVERKTIGAECNYGVRFDGPYGLDHFMEGLAKEVEKRMVGISMKGKRLTLKIKQQKEGAGNARKFLGHGSCHNLSKSASIPGGAAIRDSKVFKKIGLELFKEFGIEDINEIRGMGITISNLESDNGTENEGHAHGMRSWLQKNIDAGAFEVNTSNEKAGISNRSLDEETRVTTLVLQSTPKPKRVFEIETKNGERELENVRQHDSPLLIDLPPMSQIKMTQVEALPPEYQQHIISRMKKASEDDGEKGSAIGRLDIDMIEERRMDEEAGMSHGSADEEVIVLDDCMQWTPPSRLIVGKDTPTGVEGVRNSDPTLMIELPPMSQIQMSQVEALPPDLRQQVISRMKGTNPGRMEAEGTRTIDEAQQVSHFVPNPRIDGNGQQEYAARFRQTDLKRMMKLAAVKSGHENADISLTQLEQLPLEIKLQVVNHDDREVGILSQHPSRPTNTNDRRPRKSISNASNRMDASRSKPKITVDNQRSIEKKTEKQAKTNRAATFTAKNKDVAETDTIRKLRIIDRVDSFKEDVLPLKQFLDDNCPLRYPNSIEKVLEFLSIVFREGRLAAMVTMIRSIRNRRDAWSATDTLERIAETMNRLHIERYGSGLDVEWLMGMAEA